MKKIKTPQGVQVEELKVFIALAVDHLNKSTGKGFKANSEYIKSLLTRLYVKGYSLGQVKEVISFKCSRWMAFEERRKYLRPQTLFDVFNFKKYLKEVEASNTSNDLRKNKLIKK